MVTVELKKIVHRGVVVDPSNTRNEMSIVLSKFMFLLEPWHAFAKGGLMVHLVSQSILPVTE